MPSMFLTASGLPVPAVTAEQMMEVERMAREEAGLNRFQMMESTGRCLAQQAMDCMLEIQVSPPPAIAGGKIIILAGSGMNGGGGICAARHLRQQGVEVILCLAQDDAVADISRWQRYLYEAAHGSVGTPGELLAKGGPLLEGVCLIVDALMGCHSKHDLQASDRALIHWANQSGLPILSLDVPSGIDATQGVTLGPVMKSRWTLTLALPKTGLHPDKTGQLILADIGIPPKIYRTKSLGLNYRSPFGHCPRVPLYYQPPIPDLQPEIASSVAPRVA